MIRGSLYLKLKNILCFSLVYFLLTSFYSPKGPLAYDIIGYDPSARIVYIARTNWGDCDCETDLYKYYVQRDSFEVIYSWSKRNEYSRKKAEILKAERLSNLVKPSALLSTTKNFHTFRWLPLQKEKETGDIFDFEIGIGSQIYRYQQCFSNSTNPRIKHFRITQEVGLILITYKGDCPQGNPTDVLILCRKTDNRWESREI
jgi:hypothetical protein